MHEIIICYCQYIFVQEEEEKNKIPTTNINYILYSCMMTKVNIKQLNPTNCLKKIPKRFLLEVQRIGNHATTYLLKRVQRITDRLMKLKNK